MLRNNHNYCPNCGRKRYGTEKFCSQCGCSLNTNNQTSNISSNKVWIIAFVFICIVVGFYYLSQTDSNSSRPSISDLVKSKTIADIQSIKDVDNMRKAIDNTIWTHTEVGDLLWIKLEFKDNKVRIYNAMPSDGKWTFEEEYTYTLEEGRFMDDGRRYIAAVIKTKDLSVSPKFIITNGHLSWFGIIDAGGFILGDYEWD